MSLRDGYLKGNLVMQKRHPQVDHYKSTIQRVSTARALCLGRDVIELIGGYTEDIPKDQILSVLTRTERAWDNLWVEFEGNTVIRLPSSEEGLFVSMRAFSMYTEDEEIHLRAYFSCTDEDRQGNGGMPVRETHSYGAVRPGADKIEFRLEKMLTEGVDRAKAAGRFDIAQDIESGIGQVQRDLEVVLEKVSGFIAAMNALMISRDILREQPAERLSTIWRQRFAPIGANAPKERVSTLDLTDLGRREHQMRVQGEKFSEDHDDGQGKTARRRHWVCGHMFTARNGELTFRRPHLRGGGEMVTKPMRVIASRQEPDAEPDFGM